MSRRFGPNNESVFTTTLPVSAYPFSMATWWRGYSVASPAGYHCSLMNIGAFNSATDYMSLCLSFDAASRTQVTLDFQCRKASVFPAEFSRPVVYVNSNNDFDFTDTWHHFACTITASRQQAVYWKGTEKGTNATSVGAFLSTAAGVRIGARPTSSQSFPARGYLAHPAIWDVALEDSEILSLASGISPLRVRPSALRLYLPYFGRDSSDVDIIGKTTMITSGTTAIPEEPHLRCPRRPTVSFIDTIINEKTTSDTLLLLDSVLPTAGRGRLGTESVSLLDDAVRQARRQRTHSEAAAVNDTVDKSRALGRVAQDTASVAEFIERYASRSRTAQETLVATDFALRTVARNRLAAEGVVLFDATVASRRRGKEALETLLLSDATARQAMRNRTAIDIADITDLAELFSRRNRMATDVVATVLDAFVRSARRSYVQSDTISVFDALLASAIRLRFSADSAALVDAFTSVVTSPEPQKYSVTSTDVLQVVDFVLYQLLLGRVSTDSAQVQDAALRQLARNKLISEFASVTEQTRRTAIRNMAVIDAVIATDLVPERVLRRLLVASEFVLASDQATVVRGRVRRAEDVVSPSDTAAKSAYRNRATTDAPTVGDQTLSTRERVRRLDDGTTTNDATLRSARRNRRSDDAAMPTDQTDSVRRRTRRSDETLLASDTLARAASRGRLSSDSAAATDQSLASRRRDKLTADQLSPIDQPLDYVSRHRAALEGLSATDQSIKLRNSTRRLDDSAVPSDSIARTIGRSRLLSDLIAADDATRLSVLRTAIIASFTQITDPAAIESIFRGVTTSEALTVIDDALFGEITEITIADTIALGDAVVRSLSKVVFSDDLLSSTDARDRVLSLSRQIAETLRISESIVKRFVIGAYFDVRVLLGAASLAQSIALSVADGAVISADESPRLGSYN